MTCAEREDDLALLVSDDLDEVSAERLHQHLGRCAVCRGRLAEFRADAAWLRRQRSSPPEAEMIARLQARLAEQIARQAPASWTVAWLRRLLEGASRRGPQPLLAGLAGALLLVGAVGALSHPLDRRHGSLLGSIEETVPTHRHRDPARAEDEGGEDDGSDGEAVLADEVGEAADIVAEPEPPNEEAGLAAVGSATGESEDGKPGAMRIEMKTSDPDVRIIWFAEVDRQRSDDLGARPGRP